MGAYSATKFAQVGMAECLRSELYGSDIHVSVRLSGLDRHRIHRGDGAAKPAATSTRALGPRQSVDEVADAIARAIEHPVPEVYPYCKSRGLVLLNALAPGFTDKIVQTVRPQTAWAGPSRVRRIMTDSIRAQRHRAAVRDAGGRALFVGGWVRDRLMGRDSQGHRPRGLRRPRRSRCETMLESLGRVETVGESFQVFKAGDIDVSLPRRESKSGRGHNGFEVTGDPSMSDRGSRAPPRLHESTRFSGIR